MIHQSIRSGRTPAARATTLASRTAIFGSIAVSATFVMELTLVPLLLPAIQAQFGLSIRELAWVFNSYGVAVALGVLLGGWLGDAFRTKRVFGAGVLLFSAGSAVVAVSGNYEAMIAGRVMQGFGGGIFSPLIPLILTRLSPQRPGRILIVWGSVAGYVAAFAPMLYSSTLAGHGWQVAFLIFAVASLAALTVLQLSGAEDEAPTVRKQVPKLAKLFASRELLLLYVYVFCTYGTITYYLFRLPLSLADRSFQVVGIGLALSVMWLSFSGVSTLLRNWVDRPHVRVILLVAPVLIAAGFPLAFLYDSYPCVLLSSVLIGSGLACSNAPSTQLVLKFAPSGMGALSASFDITFARLGGVAAVALLAQSVIGLTIVGELLISALAFLCALAVANRL